MYIYIYPTHGYLMYVLFWWLLESRYEDKFHRLWRFDSANWLSQIPELKIKPCWLLKADTYTSHDVRSWKFLGGLAVEFPPRRFAVLGLTWHPNSWPATALGVGKNALGFSTSCSNGFWRLHLQCLNDTFHHPCFVIELLVSLVFSAPVATVTTPNRARHRGSSMSHCRQRWTPRNDGPPLLRGGNPQQFPSNQKSNAWCSRHVPHLFWCYLRKTSEREPWAFKSTWFL